MGDRVYLSLTIHGHIERPRDLVAICKALVEEGLGPDDDQVEDWKEYLPYFAEMLTSGQSPTFIDHQCNYANVDAAEDVLQAAKVAYSISHEAGGEFPAMDISWAPDRGRCEIVSADGAAIRLPSLQVALKEPDPLAAVRALVEDAERAVGTDLGEMTVSDRVRRMLARYIACEALGVAA